MMQSEVSLCTIAKNCADTIDIFIQWALDNFPEVNVVVDPDNEDNTLMLINQWKDSVDPGRINIIEREFDDFSTQKQRAYDMCGLKYSLLIDTDEIMEEIPDDFLSKFMEASKSDVVSFARINLQGDLEHRLDSGLDIQYRMIAHDGDVHMDGAPVDEKLDMKGKRVTMSPMRIIHLGHVRPEKWLKIKGRDRIKFMNDDPCDGPPMQEHGEDWFYVRNELLFNDRAIPIADRSIKRQIERYVKFYA